MENLSRPSGARGLKRLAKRPLKRRRHVAPFMGAWIETFNALLTSSGSRSVAPFRGAWIETTHTMCPSSFLSTSRPSGARGLKLILHIITFRFILSRPSGARGLKRQTVKVRVIFNFVAPFRGAWIETDTDP